MFVALLARQAETLIPARHLAENQIVSWGAPHRRFLTSIRFSEKGRIAINSDMGAAVDQYRIRPRKQRNGWNLESDRLSHGALWYRNESDALSYAKWNS